MDQSPGHEDSSFPGGSGGGAAVIWRGRAALDAIAGEIQNAAESVDEVRSRHQAFVCEKEQAFRRQGAHQGGEEDPAPAQRQIVAMKKNRVAAATRVARDDDIDEDCGDEGGARGRRRSSHGRVGKHLSRAQLRAREQFQNVDQGRMKRQEVFETIPSSVRRLETKVDFFRKRSELVLPPIEDRFMSREPLTGSAVVDVFKLNIRSPASGSPGPSKARLLPDALRDSVAEQENPMRRMDSTCSPQIVHDPSCQTLVLTSSASMESLQQRAQRLQEVALHREEHAQEVRRLERLRLNAKRYALLEEHERRHNWKEYANRHRLLITWMVVAISASTLKDMAQGLREALAPVRQSLFEIASTARKTTGLQEELWDTAVSPSIRTFYLLGRTKMLLMSSVQRKCRQELAVVRKEVILKSWYALLRALLFLIRLSRKFRMNRAVEVAKPFIQASWRGYEIRRAVKVYFQQITFLQRGLRYCMRYRASICRFIYLPTFWDLETQVLSTMTSTPPKVLEKELQQHRTNWDYNRCLREVRRLGEMRMDYSLSRRRKSRLKYSAEANKKPQRQATHRRQAAAFQSAHQNQSLRAGAAIPFASGGGGVGGGGAGNASGTTPGGEGGGGAGALLTHVNPFGKCFAGLTHGSPEAIVTLERRRTNPLFIVMDKLRIKEKRRKQIVESLYADAVARWWQAYLEYKRKLAEFKEKSRQWRLEACAYGVAHRAEWPEMQVPPEFPQEILKIDTVRLKKIISNELLKMDAAQLL